MVKVVVTGAAGVVGRRVCARLAARGATVLAVDRETVGLPIDGQRVDLERADLSSLFAGAEAVVHLARSFPPEAVSIDDGIVDLDVTTRVLDAAAACGVRHAVIVSSAMVYGAWPNNPVPITEEAPVRPNPEFAFAVHLAEFERRALDWRADNPATSLTILRPTVLVADAQPSAVARLLRSVGSIRTDEGDPPAQFLHADDLGDAVVAATLAEVDGVLNVAPDGWIPPATFNALVWNTPRPRLPKWLAHAIASTRWRLGLASAPPGLVPYTIYPWVIANDRLRSLGWKPANTNEEAFVLGHDPRPLDRLNARHRQQLALGITGGVIVATIGAVLAIVLWRRQRSRERA